MVINHITKSINQQHLYNNLKLVQISPIDLNNYISQVRNIII
jgi:hypothetical protein